MDDAVYHFQAINRSPKGISLKWEGKVLGSRIEGKATVSKKGKLKRNTVSAERKKKSSAPILQPWPETSGRAQHSFLLPCLSVEFL